MDTPRWPPIAGGSDAPEPSETPTDQPADVPPAESPPDPAEELARAREENASLQRELQALRAKPAPAAEPAKAPRPLATMTLADLDASAETLTPAELHEAAGAVEAKIDAGELSAAKGARLLGRLEAVRLSHEREARDAAARPVRTAEAKLGDYIRRYPDLGKRGSELLGKVEAELLDVIEEFGFPANDPRAQVLAVERVVGGHRLGGGMEPREFARRSTPVGGPGGGVGGGVDRPGRTDDPVKQVEKLYPDQITYWQRMNYTREEMAAEAPLVLARRGTRRRLA